jgi:hypothetical protein
LGYDGSFAFHGETIGRQLGMPNRTAAARLALRRGLIAP